MRPDGGLFIRPDLRAVSKALFESCFYSLIFDGLI